MVLIFIPYWKILQVSYSPDIIFTNKMKDKNNSLDIKVSVDLVQIIEEFHELTLMISNNDVSFGLLKWEFLILSFTIIVQIGYWSDNLEVQLLLLTSYYYFFISLQYSVAYCKQFYVSFEAFQLMMIGTFFLSFFLLLLR